MRCDAGPQQRQGGVDAIAAGQQVGAHHMLDNRRIELLGVHVLAGAGIEYHGVQRAPVLGNLFADLAHGLAVGQVTGHHQHLPRIALRQYFQLRHRARTDGQVRTGFQDFFGQGDTDAAAGAGQPVSS
ncbi:hypothetical protein D9M73_242240 [compost metagenome]